MLSPEDQTLNGLGLGKDKQFVFFGSPLNGLGFKDYHLTGELKPIIGRQGNKYTARHIILKYVPESEIYIEPFLGSGAIFFSKLKSKINILNDLNQPTIDTLKLIQKAPIDKSLYPSDLDSISKLESFIGKNYKDIPSQITKYRIEQMGGYMGQPIRKNRKVKLIRNPFSTLQHIDLYQDKLKGVKLLSQDYEKVIKAYDSPKAFIYLDPPYEFTNVETGYAEYKDFDFERLNKVLHSIKGKFLMSLNDSPSVKKLFSDFYIKEVNIPINRNPRFRKEVLISNFKI